MGFLSTPAASPATGPADGSVTNVLMLEIPSVTPNSDKLYTAILAQLATSGYQVHRMPVEDSAFDRANIKKSASDIANRHNVDMVFWIQLTPDSCLLFLYVREQSEKIYQRRMKLDSENLSSQYEVISNGVSSLIEETVFKVREDKAIRTEPTPSIPAVPAPPTERRSLAKLEISLMYKGMLFSRREISNGIRGSLGILVADKILLNLAFTQNADIAFESSRYKLSVSSRTLDAGVFVKIPVRSLQLRLGVSYEVQLRTYTMEPDVADLRARPGKLHDVQGVAPSIQLVWPLVRNLLFNIGVGATVHVNEHGYIVSRIDGTSYEIGSPYNIKPTFHAGLTFQSN